jgi:hypothetical protein
MSSQQYRETTAHTVAALGLAALGLAALGLGALGLAGCGGGTGAAGTGSAGAGAAGTASAGTGSAGTGSAGTGGLGGTAGRASASPRVGGTAAAKPLAFGQSRTVGDADGNLMTVTPVAAWWLPGDVQHEESGSQQAENGDFLIVEVRASAVSAGATFPAPITGFGLSIYSNDQRFGVADSVAADSVVWSACLPSITSNGQLPTGQAELNGETFDVPAGDALLEWSQPNGPTVKWQVPAKSTGALPANVQGAITSGRGC